MMAVLCVSLGGGAGRGEAQGIGNPVADPAQAQLRKKLDEAKAFPEAKYSFASWNELHAAMFAARGVADKAATTPGELQAALASVQQKIAALKEREVLPPDTAPRLGLGAWAYATARNGPVNAVSVRWTSADPQDGYELQRASGPGGNFVRVYAGPGTSFEDGPLPDGTYTYKLLARRGVSVLTSNLAQATTTPMPANVEEYSNQNGKGFPLGEPLKVGSTYYRFPGKRDGSTISFTAETSTDGKTWREGPVVLDRTSHPELDDYKLEAGTIFYDRKHDRIVWWAHWERAKGYASGRVMVASCKPGERFTVHRIYTPLGVQARDQSVFTDDDGQHYLVSASNVAEQRVNATLYIFRLNDDCTDVTGIVSKVQEGQVREAPCIVKSGGFYYLFSSQNAGWFPSRGSYVSARALEGRWSEPRTFTDSSTFSSQSGGVGNYRDGAPPAYLFAGSRWVRAEGTSGNVAVPITLADGFVFGDYAPTLLYDPGRSRFIPLQAGTLLSRNRPAASSVPGAKGAEADKAFDGDYATAFRSDARAWPFSVATDLGAACRVRNVQISWHIHNGSEAYYKYTVDGSPDGRQWRVLLDRTNDKDMLVNKTYGFSSDLLPDAPEARYVRITVQRAVLHNNANNWYPTTLEEVKVFGDRK